MGASQAVATSVFLSILLFLTCRICLSLEHDVKDCAGLLRVDEVKSALERIRGLELKSSVMCSRIDSSLSSEMLMADYTALFTEDKIHVLSEIYQKFTDSEAKYDYSSVRNYLYFVKGFYEPLTKSIFVIEDDPFQRIFMSYLASGREFSIEEMMRLVRDTKPEPDKREEEITLIHEFSHAMQDEYYDLAGLMAYADGNSDMGTAFKAIIEGEASWTGTEYEAHVKKIGQSNLPDYLDVLENLKSNARREREPGEEENKFNTFIGALAAFPYIQGQAFMQSVRRDKGFSEFGAIMRDPPMSTEQILHPDKYFVERDQPTAIDMAPVKEFLATYDEVEIVGEDTLGELGLMQILSTLIPSGKAIATAEGWDGDRYVAFRDEDGGVQIAMFTVWDSEQESLEFLKNYSEYSRGKNLRRKHAGKIGENGNLYETIDGYIYVERRGNEVAIVDEFTLDGEPEEIVEALWECGREETSTWQRDIAPLEERETSLSGQEASSQMSKAVKLSDYGYSEAAYRILDVLAERGLLSGENALSAAVMMAKDESKLVQATELLASINDKEKDSDRYYKARAAEIILMVNGGGAEQAVDALCALYGEGKKASALISLMFSYPLSELVLNDPGMAEALSGFGEWLFEQEDLKGAEEVLKKAARLQPEDETLSERHAEVKKIMNEKKKEK